MKAGRGAPGKSSRAIFAFYGPRPPLGSFTKKWAFKGRLAAGEE
jgi:hypothetical protein